MVVRSSLRQLSALCTISKVAIAMSSSLPEELVVEILWLNHPRDVLTARLVSILVVRLRSLPPISASTLLLTSRLLDSHQASVSDDCFDTALVIIRSVNVSRLSSIHQPSFNC